MTDSIIYSNHRPRVLASRAVHIRRKLNGAGSLSVQVRDEVKPFDIIGSSNFSGGFAIVNLAQKLDVHPAEVSKYMQRVIGQTIFKGELLAERKALFRKKIVTAPTDGVINSVNSETGEVQLQFLSKKVALTAGVYGVVDMVDHKLGEVLIKCLVTEVYGVIGIGKERSGIIHIMGRSDSLLQENQLTAEMNQRILITGALINREVLKKAATLRVQGIIGGGMNYTDFKAVGGTIHHLNKGLNFSDVGVSVVVTEGFGPTPIGEDVFKVVIPYEGTFGFIDGNRGVLTLPSDNPDSILSLRKVELPATASNDVPPEILMEELKLNQQVRVVGSPFFGSLGIVVGIDQTPTVLQSGVATFLTTVKIGKQQIRIPYLNLEII